jgi:IMP and pyridine-specific 5'-nucleotidase
VVTAAGYEYNVEKYEFRLSGLLNYFKSKSLTEEECQRFYLFGGECNYLMVLGKDFRLHPVKETGPGGWITVSGKRLSL